MSILRCQLFYDPPYGGESLRRKRICEAKAKVDGFLAHCTNAGRPTSKLTIYEEGSRALYERSRGQNLSKDAEFALLRETGYERSVLVREAQERFGPGRHTTWLGGASGLGFCWEWCGEDERNRRTAMYDFALAREKTPKIRATACDDKPSMPALTLSYDYSFQLTQPGSTELIPFQQSSWYPPDWITSSSLLLSLEGGSSSMIFAPRFPYEDANDAFAEYWEQVCGSMQHKLNSKRVKVFIPNKRGDNCYVRKLDWTP